MSSAALLFVNVIYHTAVFKVVALVHFIRRFKAATTINQDCRFADWRDPLHHFQVRRGTDCACREVGLRSTASSCRFDYFYVSGESGTHIVEQIVDCLSPGFASPSMRMAMETCFQVDGPLAKLVCIYNQLPFQGKIVVYQLSQHAFFGVNLMFDSLCYLQFSQSRWNDSDASVSAENLKATHQVDLNQVKRLILSHHDVAFKETDLVCLFDSLPSVNTEEVLLGRVWDGRILRTNKSSLELVDWVVMRPLSILGIRWGKRFRDQYTGDPLLFNWLKRVYVPLPICGSVTVADIKWRGISTGTMVYNNQSWKDFFRVLEHDPVSERLVLLGAWTNRWQTAGWFTLTWDPSTPVE